MQEGILSVDIGTSSLKAGLVTSDGTVYGGTQYSYAWASSVGEPFFAEQWETAFQGALQGILGANQGNRNLASGRIQIVGIVVSGHGPTLVPIGEDDRPVGPVLMWIDGNREAQGGTVSFFLPKVGWFRKYRPQEFSRTRFFLTCPEYLSWVLTGEVVAAIPHGDFGKYFWDPGQIVEYGFGPTMFPRLINTGEPIGQVGTRAAEKFGIPEGTPVFAGGSDFLMSLAGSGTLKPGMVCDRAGTSEGVNYCAPHNVIIPGLRTLPHVLNGLWNIGGILPASGLLFEWFRRLTNQTNRSYSDILKDVRSLDGTWDYPQFEIDPEGTGKFSQGAFRGLEPWHGPGHISRGVVEALGFKVLGAIENLVAAGLPVRNLRMCGGQAKNDLWCGLKASILGIPLEIPRVADAELLGDAMAGFLGLGVFGDLEEAAATMVRIERVWEPNPEYFKIFQDRYRARKLKESQSIT